MQWIYLAVGLAGMLLGAKWLVDGCVRLSRRFGFSEFVVSVIIIGMGTSLPELFVSLFGGARDLGGLILSTNIASNVINIWGVLGVGALISPILIMSVRKHLAELVFMSAASIVLAVFVWTGGVGRLEGVALFAILFGYLWYARVRPRIDGAPLMERSADNILVWKIIILIVIGILALYFGSDIFIDSVQKVAAMNSLDQTMAGILIVAPATATPEFLVTVIAAFKRRPEIAVGNIIGSNFMNIVLVIAAGALIVDLPVSKHVARLDIIVMLFATAMLCFDLLYWKKLTRFRGALYLVLLSLYLWASVSF